jgi:hypothetical protein
MKFCKIDYVGEVTRCAKNGWNRLAGGGPSKAYLNIPYLTYLFFLVIVYSKIGLTNLNTRWLKRRGLL